MKLGDKGFTLVELIIVIAIIAVLAGTITPMYIKYVNRAKESVCQTNLDSVVKMYSIDRYDNESKSLDEVLDQAAADVGATKISTADNVHTYSGLCPSGGKVTAEFSTSGDGSVTLVCDKHSSNQGPSYAYALVDTVVSKSSELSRKIGGTAQTLHDYLYPNNKLDSKKYIDSGSGDTTSFTSIIKGKLPTALADTQSWTITGNSSGGYTIYVTTGGNVSAAKVGTKVNAQKYEYDSTGKLVSKDTVKMTVANKSANKTLNYNFIRP